MRAYALRLVLINRKRGFTAETALLLGEIFKNSPQFWMGLQMDWDLWHARQKLKKSA